MHVAGLFLYPVKSLRGHALDGADVEPRGLAGDRRWMIVDPTGRFVTRRELPHMALIDVEPLRDGLRLHHPALGWCDAETPEHGPVRGATVWRDPVAVRLGAAPADDFLSDALGRRVHLAWQPRDSVRPVAPGYALSGDHVSLADGFPLLVTTEASLAALNDALAVPVPMARFRPNLVIAGAEPWAEDRWRFLRIGRVVLRLAKPCARCVVVTQQPLTGERLEGNEPLATLRAMGRMASGGIMFGQNAIPDALGRVHVGDPVEVLEEGESNVVPRALAAGREG